MNFTPEQQLAVNRFKAIMQVATQQTGVVMVAAVKSVDYRLPDGTPRTEVTGYLDYAILNNWQPPNEATAETLSTNVDSDNPD